MGYLPSAIFFCVVILIPWIGWSRFRLNEIFAFWFAYVVTRPLGASFADYMSKPHSISGINFGDGPTSAVLTLAIVILVAATWFVRAFFYSKPTASPAAGSRSCKSRRLLSAE